MSSTSLCRALRSGKGAWKLRKQLRQPHGSSRRATDHDDSSSTVGSSPGVVEKRILGVDPSLAACKPVGAILAALAGGSCKVLHMNF